MNIGDKAPEVLGINEKGVEIRLSDYKGKKIVLYFYPKDMTSGCTAQACNLRDNYADLRKAGYEVIGVSVDSEKSHQKFIEKNNLPFTLIADTDKKLVEQFGVWGEKSMYGRHPVLPAGGFSSISAPVPLYSHLLGVRSGGGGKIRRRKGQLSCRQAYIAMQSLPQRRV